MLICCLGVLVILNSKNVGVGASAVGARQLNSAAAVALENIRTNLPEVGCSRNMTCDPGVCTAVPTLPDSTIAAAFAGHTVQFVGDSVTAQFE